ncbi:unnamed protein product [Rhizophagus irregularis]|nr:unnamed protein product [Rhizophagus irregularis]
MFKINSVWFSFCHILYLLANFKDLTASRHLSFYPEETVEKKSFKYYLSVSSHTNQFRSIRRMKLVPTGRLGYLASELEIGFNGRKQVRSICLPGLLDGKLRG